MIDSANEGASRRAPVLSRGRRAGPPRMATVALTVCALLGAGCGKGAGAAEARADVARAGVTGTSATPAVTAINAVSAELYARLAEQPGNLLFSPYSIEIALAMARNGARGETRTQMDAVLRAGAGDELDKALNLLDQELAARPGHKGDKDRNGDVELATANALWGQKDTTFEQAFLVALASHYGAGMKLVDYKTAAEAARNDINTWASDRTKGKIVDLLPQGSLDDLTRLVLTNAIYFKAPWVKRFSPVPAMPFTKADGTSTTVDGMVTSKVGAFGKGAGWKAGEIPYLGGDLSMVVIVPDDLAAFEASLDADTLGAITAGFTDQLATLQMPKFSFRSKAQLKDHLSELGMPLAFTDQADFSGMTSKEKLKISDVFHQAFIAVDEEGTEAAAATAVVMEAVSGPIGESLVVDKPFLFAIRDVKTHAVLFLGRVSDPTVH